jgi:hypothetical protein
LIHWIGGHHILPFWPFRISYRNSNWPALGETMANATGYGHFILLKLHPRAPAKTKPSAGKSCVNVSSADLHSGRQSLQNCGQGWAVRFSSGKPTQHGSILSLIDQ